MLLRKLYNLAHLLESQYEPPDAVMAMLTKKVSSYLCYICKHSPYYNKIMNDFGLDATDIKGIIGKFPIVDRSTYKKLSLDMIAALNIKTHKYKHRITSGSTSMPMIFYFTKNDLDFLDMLLMRAFIANGVKLGYKVAHLNNCFAKIERSCLHSLYLYRSDVVSIFKSAEQIVSALERLRPDVISGFPTAIKLVARLVRQKGITKIKPKKIFTGSESLEDNTRSYIRETFGVDVIDTYGSAEMGIWAWECGKHEGYHMSTDALFVEFLDGFISDNELIYDLVCTNPHSHIMPLIRYRVGDCVILSKKMCSCGRTLPLIKKIVGRTGDFVLNKNRELISPMAFLLGLMYFANIFEYQIVQKSPRDILVRIVPKENFSLRDEAEIVKRVRDIMGDSGTAVNIEKVSNIEREMSGKFRYVKSELGKRYLEAAFNN